MRRGCGCGAASSQAREPASRARVCCRFRSAGPERAIGDKLRPMSPLSFLLNILWLICGGLVAALAWVLAAVVMAITIIGLPWSFAALRIALYTLLPFGHEM